MRREGNDAFPLLDWRLDRERDGTRSDEAADDAMSRNDVKALPVLPERPLVDLLRIGGMGSGVSTLLWKSLANSTAKGEVYGFGKKLLSDLLEPISEALVCPLVSLSRT